MTQANEPRPRRPRGSGTIVPEGKRWALYMPINGTKKYLGSFDTYEQADAQSQTLLVASAGSLTKPTWREMGAAYLQSIKSHFKSYTMYRDTFYSVLCDASFVDEPIDVTQRPALIHWAERELPAKLKKRSILKNGKRKTIELKGQRISHAHAVNAVAVLRAIWNYACDLGHLQLGDELCKGLGVPEDRRVNKGKGSRMPVLTLPEIELLLTCRTCAPDDAARAADVETLAQCPHCPFEIRTAYAIEIHQALRKGELQGMNWEACDFQHSGWHIRQNRDGSTKGRRDTWQAWLPRAERFIRKWHALAGHPERGIMFPSRAERPKQTGPRRRFVSSQPEHLSAREVVERGRAAGIQLTELAVHQYRSADRKVRVARAPRRYAPDYDWAWSGSMSSQQGWRPGWPERLGVTSKITFHQLRDTCASHLLSGSWGERWDIKDVSEHLTHKLVSTTELRYAHLLKDAKRRSAAATETDPSRKTLVGERKVGAEARRSKSLISLAPEAGFEPATTRLTVERFNKDLN